MKKWLLYICGGVSLSLVTIWTSFVVTFPEQALQQWLQSEINAQVSLKVTVSSVDMKWNRLEIPNVSVYPTSPEAKPILFNVVLPISWRWVSGIPIEIMQGSDAKIFAMWPWEQNQAGSIRGEVELKAILPWLDSNIREITKIDGRLDFSLETDNMQQLAAISRLPVFPPFKLQATLQKTEINILPVAALGIPPVSLSLCQLDLSAPGTGAMTVNQLECKGGLNLSISGSVQPNLGGIAQSQLQLEVSMTPDLKWHGQIKKETGMLIDLFLKTQHPGLGWDTSGAPQPLKFKLNGVASRPRLSL